MPIKPYECGARVIEVLDGKPVLIVGTVVAQAWSCNRAVVWVRYNLGPYLGPITVRYAGPELAQLARFDPNLDYGRVR